METLKADCCANTIRSLFNLPHVANISVVTGNYICVVTGGRMSISVAVARFDATAYGKGQLQAIRKQPLSYELYVVNSRAPVEQPRLTVPETVQQHTHPLAEGEVCRCWCVDVCSCAAKRPAWHGLRVQN